MRRDNTVDQEQERAEVKMYRGIAGPVPQGRAVYTQPGSVGQHNKTRRNAAHTQLGGGSYPNRRMEIVKRYVTRRRRDVNSIVENKNQQML